MFTGIIQAIGQIDTIKAKNGDIAVKINAATLPLDDTKEGDSIAVNGVCLTATGITATHFHAVVSKETLSVTKGLDSQSPVNLEKALKLHDYLGGHLVSGHIDGVGQVMSHEPVGDCWLLVVKAPHHISKYIARKGSICINGVSLTVNDINQDTFSVNIIPHTAEKTTLGALKVSSQVNLEVDQLARYVERILQWEKESK